MPGPVISFLSGTGVPKVCWMLNIEKTKKKKKKRKKCIQKIDQHKFRVNFLYLCDRKILVHNYSV